jgi:hypothetical protein
LELAGDGPSCYVACSQLDLTAASPFEGDDCVRVVGSGSSAINISERLLPGGQGP